MTTLPVVSLRGITRTYPGASLVRALQPTDLTVYPGDSVAVTGRSGSGKSTLLHLLGLLDRPTAGSYLLDGIDTGALGDADRTRLRARRLGFVFQGFHLLPYRSVIENVMLALLYDGTPHRARRQRAARALERVGLSHRLAFLPTALSGGERQRVAIARAVVSEPALLLADEPTGNLDSATAEEVLAVFADLHAAALTTIVVTHDEAVAARAQRRLHIHDGRLTEQARESWL